MKKWKRALAVATATTVALSATSIQSLAYTEGTVEEGAVQADSKLDEESNVESVDSEKTKETTDVESTKDEKAQTAVEAQSSKEETSNDEVSEDETLKEEAEAEKADTNDSSADDENDKAELKDGLYRGSAKGFKSTVTVEVRVSNGKIENISVVSHNDTERFFNKALAVIDSILNSQSTDVDTVSGATYSSKGIKEATANALASDPINEDEQEEKNELSGQGTKEDPFVISNEKELIILRDSVNYGESYQGKYIEQTADIELTDAWTPIGTGKNNPFSGSYDGNNYTITNLSVTSDSVATDGVSFYAGLFGYATTYADFSDIKLNGVKIDVTDKSGIVYAGALVGSMYNTVTDGSQISVVDNCSASGTINVQTNAKSTMTGGLVGNILTNSWLVADYYSADNAYGANLGNVDKDTVSNKSVEEMSTSEFATLMHSNLSNESVDEIAEKVNADGKISFEAYKARVANYHDWKLTGSDVVLSDNLWAEISEQVEDSIFEAGDGSQENPYIIASEKQLFDFNKSLNADEDYAGTYVALGSDIKLTKEWNLVGGNTPYPFSGVFDGKGYTISGLRIGSEENSSDYRYAGLFQYLLGAIVKDVKFTDAKIYTKTNDDKRYYAGVLAAAAEAEGTNGYVDSVYIDNAYVNVSTNSGAAYAADVTISSERYTNDLGQISGRNTGISYGSSDYYNKTASIVCGGETVETKAVGTVVEEAVTTEFYGMSKADFDSDALLVKLNAAAITAPVKQIAEASTPLAGNADKNTVVNGAENTNNSKVTNSKSRKAASTEEEKSTEEVATEDSESEENLADEDAAKDDSEISNDNVETIEDEEVPEAAEEITEADEPSSNVMLILVICILALAALGFFGIQFYNTRKGK